MCSSLSADFNGPYAAGSSLLTGGKTRSRSMWTGLIPANICLANSPSRSHASLSSEKWQNRWEFLHDIFLNPQLVKEGFTVNAIKILETLKIHVLLRQLRL
nr:hypothetical protein Itr_chr15CG14690 [Ipomoea trifida]